MPAGSADNKSTINPQKRHQTVEEVLDQIGTGKFHYLLCFILGLGFAQASIAVVSISLLLPAASAELSLDAQQQSMLLSFVCLGMVVGAALSAFLADNWGRKLALTTLLTILVGAGIVTAFAPGFEVLLISRMAVGVGDGGFFPIVLTYYVEFLPIKGRGPFMVGLQLFWIVGSCLNASFGWAFIPNYGWRVFQISTISPAILTLCLLAIFVPESPRFFMVINRPEKAQVVLAYLEKMSRRKNKQIIDVYNLELVQDEHEIEKTQQKMTCGEFVKSGFARFTSLLTNRSIRRTTLLALLFSLILNGISGIVQPWMPTLFQHFGTQSLSIYEKNFIATAGSIPANIVSLLVVDRLGRKKSMVVGFSFWAVGLLAFCFCPMTSLWPVLAACFANGMGCFCWNVFSTWTSELFPTEVRSSGMSLLQCLGYLTTLIFTFTAGMIYVIDVYIPILAAIILAILGAIAILPLPETKGASLKDQLHIQSASDLEKLNQNKKNQASEKVPLLSENKFFREDTAHGGDFFMQYN